MDELYSGGENDIKLISNYKRTLVCAFKNIYRYPFVEETCPIAILLRDTDARLIDANLQIIDNGPTQFMQYNMN